jgi:hypothetical protein
MSVSVRPSGQLQIRDSANGRRLARAMARRRRDAIRRSSSRRGSRTAASARRAARSSGARRTGPSPTDVSDAGRSGRPTADDPRRRAARDDQASRRGPAFATVGAEWLEHGERKRGLAKGVLERSHQFMRTNSRRPDRQHAGRGQSR